MMKRFIVLVSLVAIVSGCESLESYTAEESDTNQDAVAAAEVPAPVAAGNSGSTSSGSSGGSSTPSSNLSYGGFLWKPVSESTGNLVVLLPASLTGNVHRDSVVIARNSNGSGVIETGRFAGDSHNGGREHYYFNKPGASYGNNIYVNAKLKTGGQQSWYIPNGASRVE